MSDLQLFEFESSEFRVRTQLVDGEPVFVGQDVCAAVGLSNYRNALAQLESDERVSLAVDTLGGTQKMVGVTEAGVWSLAMMSRSPSVKSFKRWLTHDVLPQIRKTGSYGTPQLDVRNLDHLSLMLDAGKAALNRAVAAEAKVAELAPAAAHAEVFRAAEGLRSIGDVANDFKTHAIEAFPGVKVTHQMIWDHAGLCHLVIRGNTVRHNQPTSQAISADWAKPHRVQYSTHTRGDQTTVTTRLTPRGEARLWDHLVKYITAHGSLSLQKELTS